MKTLKTLKPLEEMDEDEMSAEVHQLLDRIVALKRQVSFMPEYREKATPEECLGIALSQYFEWSSLPILKTCYEGLTDANFHSAASVLDLLIEQEN